MDDNEILDTDLYRSRPRYKGQGWEDYEPKDGSAVRGKDLEEEDRKQRSNFIREELARRKKAIELNGTKVRFIFLLDLINFVFFL